MNGVQRPGSWPLRNDRAAAPSRGCSRRATMISTREALRQLCRLLAPASVYNLSRMLVRAWSSAAVALTLGAVLIGISLLGLYTLNRVETAGTWVAHTYAVSSDLNA